ncbi:MAG TPA: response regulator, partial [Chromatiaceae bacterium]|nr:response regulator [Chromatiaceae bacterium]
METMDTDMVEMVLLPMAGRSVLALIPDRSQAVELSTRLQRWSIDVLPAHDIGSAERLLREAYFDYSPVVALVIAPSMASSIDIPLQRWFQEGLVARDVTVIVAATGHQSEFESLAPEQRVSGRRMWVGSEEELFNALHTIQLPAEEEGVFGLGKNVASPLNILIADDNATNRLVLAGMLRNAGHRVTEKENGTEFLEAIEEDDYDLAMIDLHMPDMNGLEVYQLYRFAHAGEETIPFVMITADVTETTRAACEEAGIEHLLSKPISASHLFETIEKLGIGQSNIMLDHEEILSSFPKEEAPLVDKHKVDELLSLDAGTDLVARIMDCFNEDVEKLLDQLRMVVGLKDYFGMRELAHALRGSAANVGMTRVQLLSEQWERMSEMEFNNMDVTQVEELAELVQESAYQLSIHFGLEQPRPKLRVIR